VGGGGRVEPERRKEGQQFTKLGQKYKHDRLYLHYINSNKHLPLSLFTGQFVLDDDIVTLVNLITQSLAGNSCSLGSIHTSVGTTIEAAEAVARAISVRLT
jgi:hypothetical protein